MQPVAGQASLREQPGADSLLINLSKPEIPSLIGLRASVGS